MTRAPSRVEDCCSWCRRPARLCTASSCDDAGTYPGVHDGEEWQEVAEVRQERELALAA